MASLTGFTYNSLIKPIPPSTNLANVSAQEPIKTCQSCAAIVPDCRKANRGTIAINYERVDLYPDFPDLKASARNGCGLCKLLRKTIRAKWATRPMEEWGVGPLTEKEGVFDELLASSWDRKVRIRKLSFVLENTSNSFSTPVDKSPEQVNHNDMVVRLDLEFGPATLPAAPEGTPPYGDISQVIGFKIFDSQDLNSTNHSLRRRLPSPSTLSKVNLDLISTWTSDCKKYHSKCQLDPLTWIPSRLLYVGPADGTEDPRLIETSQECIQGHYAALSHMWGSSRQLPPLRTMKSNYEKMKSGIPMWELSKNFAHAVIVTRRLGLRYIWIDSLCILQDEPQDWQKEAVMMHKVYTYAEVTIVATSSTSAHDGFLERDLSMIEALRVGYSLDADTSISNYFILSAFGDAEGGTSRGDIESSLWNRRGWTCQERKLSTRMLHFCKDKLYFECRTCLRSEENEPPDSRPFHLWPRNEGWMQKSINPTTCAVDPLFKAEMYKLWTQGVLEYTQRLLTKDSDKLPAIQSIAEEMSAAINDTYLSSAGMWKGNLVHDLLWRVNDGLTVIPSKYRAPTWSWASLDANLSWQQRNITPLSPISHASFEVLEIADRSFENKPQTFLKAKVCLKPIAFIIEAPYYDRWITTTRGTLPYDIFTTTPVSAIHGTSGLSDSPLSLPDRESAIEQRQATKFAEGHLDLDDKDGLTSSPRTLFYMHVDDTHTLSGLILESVKGMEGVWKRVGVVTIFDKGGGLFLEPCFGVDDGPVEVTII